MVVRNSAEQSWMKRPLTMSPVTASQAKWLFFNAKVLHFILFYICLTRETNHIEINNNNQNRMHFNANLKMWGTWESHCLLHDCDNACSSQCYFPFGLIVFSDHTHATHISQDHIRKTRYVPGDFSSHMCHTSRHSLKVPPWREFCLKTKAADAMRMSTSYLISPFLVSSIFSIIKETWPDSYSLSVQK